MKKIIVALLIVSTILGAIFFFLSRFTNTFLPEQIQPGETRQVTTKDSSLSKQTIESRESVDYKTEVVVENLEVPWSIIFSSEDRLIVTERAGRIRLIENGVLQETPMITLSEVSPVSEAGLMGMTLDPDYQSNKFFYACYAYDSDNGLRDRVIKLKDNGSSAQVIETIIENIPAARFHAGCQLGIGPDNKLYITTGDATSPDRAQDMSFLGGKILRLNLDGTIPTDNPFKDSPVYSLGHRNPQGIDWHPTTGELYSAEHGPSGNDGPPGGDEINRIVKGENYGWNIVSHQNSDSRFKDPLITFTPAEAPGSLLVYSGKVFHQFTHNIFFGALRGESIMRLEISVSDPDKVIEYEKLDLNFGRIREIVESPEGLIYFTTINQDGRGTIQEGDDKIIKLIPTIR